MSIIRTAKCEDIPELKRLWQICFRDEAAYIDDFFSALFCPENTVVLDENGAVSGAAYLLDLGYIISEDKIQAPCAVTYALGVLPEYRGIGGGEKLTRSCIGLCEKRGVIPVICPAEGSLFDYYRRCSDYRSEYYVNLFDALPRSGDVRGISAAEYAERREILLRDRCHIAFTPGMTAWQEKLCRDTGGGLFAVGDAVAAVECGDRLIAREYLGDTSLAGAIAARLGFGKITVRTPADDLSTPFAMSTVHFTGKPAWFGFAFD